MTKKICISGYYGFDNFGDETILKILVENIKKSVPDCSITVFSSNPKKTKSLLNVESIHSFDILNVLRKLLFCNCLISGGGSLLQDATSTKSLIYYLCVLFAAQLFFKKTIIFAQGIGPIKNIILAKITSYILHHAYFISVRDDNSINLLSQWNIKAVKCNDPVWNLDITNQEKTGIIGIQLRSWKHDTNDDFIHKLALCINENFADKEIWLLSLHNQIDLPICRSLSECLYTLNHNLNIKVIENTSNEKVLNDISKMEAIIAMRYHACLIAIKANIKLLPISYDIKVDNLAKEFNLSFLKLENYGDMPHVVKEFRNKNISYNKEKIAENSFDFDMLKNIL